MLYLCFNLFYVTDEHSEQFVIVSAHLYTCTL